MNAPRACTVITGFLLATCCVAYPALVTGASSVLFPHQASGSLIVRGEKVVGSELIGQPFDKPETHPEYFWGRPSAASIDGATGILVSSGSNQGPLSDALQAEVQSSVEALHATGVRGLVPVDLVTRSASGLDPHITPAAAAVQVPRVARARALPEAELSALVAEHTEGRTLGLLGEPRVNVLLLNLALDGFPGP
jgi:potassium-transporting ATPase KdpC subunit